MLCDSSEIVTLTALLTCLLFPVSESIHNTTFIGREKRMSSKGNRANKGIHYFHCPLETNPDSVVQICSSPKASEQDGVHNQNCDMNLSFSVLNTSIQLCVNLSRLFMPNASIIYVSKITRSYPVYYEELSENIKSFFNGNIVIFRTLFPFSGEFHNSKLIGKAVVSGTFLRLSCNHDTKVFKDVKVKECFACKVFCIHSNSYYKHNENDDVINIPLNETINQNTFSSSKTDDRFVKMRRKRKPVAISRDPRKLACTLALVADHQVFNYVGGKNGIATTNIMLGLVDKVNAIFRKNFNSEVGFDQVSFVVKKITVYEDERSSGYKLDDRYMTADEYLKKFSLYDFSSVCLAVGFTFRDFGGVMGTAFPAFLSLRKPGGICNKRIKINSHYVSYNTVIMSLFSPQGHLSEETLALMLTHELGHSFGARHDETEECHPGPTIGNYIMSETVNNGLKENNFLFSPCSMRNMIPVIAKKANCLQPPNLNPVCGNAIPEVGEECDCGMSHQCDAEDPCCTPADATSHKPCTIRRHARKLCSPKVSPCCNSLCGFVLSDSQTVCNSLNVCQQKMTCNGKSEHCPQSLLMSSCPEDVCRSHNLSSCHCQGANTRCKACCRQNSSQTCQPAAMFNMQRSMIPFEFECNNLHLRDASPRFLIDNANNVFDEKGPDYTWIILSLALLTLLITLGCCYSVNQPYQPNVGDDLKGFKYGKLLSIFSIGHYETDKCRKRVTELNKIFCEKIENGQRKTNLDYIWATARLKTLFPRVRIGYLAELVKLSANENMAVRILLTQQVPMISFSKSIKDLRDAMRHAAIRYKE